MPSVILQIPSGSEHPDAAEVHERVTDALPSGVQLVAVTVSHGLIKLEIDADLTPQQLNQLERSAELIKWTAPQAYKQSKRQAEAARIESLVDSARSFEELRAIVKKLAVAVMDKL